MRRAFEKVEALLPATSAEFARICEFLYRRTGLVFTETKRYYVDRRIADRMSALGMSSVDLYFARLREDVDGEIEKFINAFTVNETYFYREEHQLRCLTEDLLPERLQTKPSGNSIRLWSVPCASGEEPYSLAIWLLENWMEVDRHEIEILGSDIDTHCLEQAQAGAYDARALMRLPPVLIEKYFEPANSQKRRIVSDLRDSVQFTQVNLVDSLQTRRCGTFDVIFCRNVLIYFDDASRRLAAENLYDRLAPGGFICLGHAESMSRISPLFEVRRFADAIVYQRPLEKSRG